MPAERLTDTPEAPPAGCRSPVGERGRNTDFTGWPSTEGQTGSQHALDGKSDDLRIRRKLQRLRPGTAP
ncbi:hypothetical protein CWI23_23445 [Pseudomonas aeruginosa]|nr:hypothetical protein CWI22_23400 [Pseudomonas aeruginosa]AUA90015.1 hypothetical protein CWI23_16575 [Pseudomonas aeruginosa]AUA91301.1 hypothetical protein CWI23_23445 [Pseudomonas aeruginosa]